MTRQLPVGTCLRHAVSSVRNNLRQAFRVSWPWFLVLLALGVIVTALIARDVDNFAVLLLGTSVWLLVLILAGAAIAIRWHRYILLDETTSSVGEIMRLDNKTWRYFGNVLLIALTMGAIQVLVSLPVELATRQTPVGGIVEFALSIALTIFCGVLTYRLSVKLPAIALDRHDFRFSHAWEATRDNALPLSLIFVIQLVVSLLILVVVYFLLIALLVVHPVLGIIGMIILTAYIWLLSIFNITLLTSFYGFFVEGRDF